MLPNNAKTLDPVEDDHKVKTVECGKDAATYFHFQDGYKNLNHGSFGTYPAPIRSVLRHYQDQAEAKPDAFIRYDYRNLLDQSRAAIAEYVHAPVSTCVFVSNATIGVNTVLRGLVFEPGDVILYFATIYGACEKTITYITETTSAESKKIEYTYPVSDRDLCSAFERAIHEVKTSGGNPKIAIFDTITSLPGVRMPFERLVSICRANSVFSLVDGAHGVGHIALDLTTLDPDFFVSNCHKWLFVPRGCAVFYVPERNQHLIRSTLPTSHGFIPKAAEATINNPLPPSGKSDFVANFEFVGTLDNSNYLCVPAALKWRRKITWEGKRDEEAVLGYMKVLARRAGEVVASALGTKVMENEEGTLGECSLSNVILPLSYAEVAGSDPAKAMRVGQWVAQVLVDEYKTFIAIIFYGDAWWVRLSAQVYLTIEDFRWAGRILDEVCGRVRAGEWQRETKSRL